MKNSEQSEQKASTLYNMAIGALSGTIASTITCPMEVIQTRIQSTVDLDVNPRRINLPHLSVVPKCQHVQVNVHNSKVIQVFLDIVKQDGLRGFYKGLLPIVLGVAPTRAVYFSVYQKMKRFCDHRLGDDYKVLQYMCSGVTASMSAASVTSPIWVVKTHLQIKKKVTNTNISMRSVIKEIFHKEGVAGFFRGLSSSYVGTIESMMYFVIYEKMKECYDWEARSRGRYERSSIDNAKAACLSKLYVSMMAYPHEVIRTRMRQSLRDSDGNLLYKSFFGTFARIIKEEGIRTMYSGLSVHLFRQIPNTTIMFTVYEFLSSLAKS